MIVRDFLTWWANELAELSPAWLSRTLSNKVSELEIRPKSWSFPPDEADADQRRAHAARLPIDLWLGRGGTAQHLGTTTIQGIRTVLSGNDDIDARTASVRLKLSPGYFLQRRLKLPLAAEHDLARIVALEMDRETPFAAEDVYWGVAITARDRLSNTLDADLCLVPKSDLGAVMTLLGESDLEPDSFALDGAEHEPPPSIDLRAGGGVQQSGSRFYALTQWGLAAMILLAIGFPTLRQSFALHQMQAKIDALQPGLDEINRLRAKSGGAQRIAAAIAAQPNVLDLLSAVTAALPDDTSLTDLTYQNRKLVLDGRSKDSARLIGTLSKSPLLVNPTFSAPVSRTEDDTADLFQITAQVAAPS